MFKNTKLLKYLSALTINLVLAYPFIHFLFSPQNASNAFITGVGYILFLRLASFCITFQAFLYKQARAVNYFLLLMPVLLFWKVFQAGTPVLVFYFIGGVIVDLIIIYQTKAKKIMSLMMSGMTRIMLLLGLALPAGCISWLIPKKSFVVIAANSNADAYYKDAGNLIFVIVLLILYYIFEPFAQPIFDMVFDPNSKLAKVLHKKL